MAVSVKSIPRSGAPHPDSRIAQWDPTPAATLGELGAEPPLSEEETAVVEVLRRFAAEEMRPLGQRLDRMSAAAIIAPDSPLWPFIDKYRELGFSTDMLFDMEPRARARMMCLTNEELAYGDVGLAFTVGAATFPRFMALLFGNEFLIEQCPETKIGSWGITEPDHGSDNLDPNSQLSHPQGRDARPNCVAKLKGDRIIINGQKSAWVSNGTIAEQCVLYCACDSGVGADIRDGCVVVVPLDLKGVTKGKPLEKMGQRALNQGEIFFDQVEVPAEYLLASPEYYQRAVYTIHHEANGLVAAALIGVARAAYDLAYNYVHERRQGGVPIIRHQSVATRLFHMYRKLEANRALARRVVEYNALAEQPSLQSAMAAKVGATQAAFEIASDALQLFGGNGMTREYPMEKLFRDARAGLIEDGCNEVLAVKGGYGLANPELL